MLSLDSCTSSLRMGLNRDHFLICANESTFSMRELPQCFLAKKMCYKISKNRINLTSDTVHHRLKCRVNHEIMSCKIKNESWCSWKNNRNKNWYPSSGQVLPRVLVVISIVHPDGKQEQNDQHNQERYNWKSIRRSVRGVIKNEDGKCSQKWKCDDITEWGTDRSSNIVGIEFQLVGSDDHSHQSWSWIRLQKA